MTARDYSKVPAKLKALRQWVVFRVKYLPDGTKDAMPYNPRTGKPASHSDSRTWGTYEEALAMKEKDPDLHLGMSLENLIGIDFDHASNEAERNTQEIIYSKVVSYTERSLSGEGAHIICLGTIPNAIKRPHVEIYGRTNGVGSPRFFIMTGDHVEGRPTTVEDCNDVVNAIVAEDAKQRGTVLDHSEPATHSDRSVYDLCASYANGEKFLDLWEGRWEGKYHSQSEADYALTNMLAFASPNNEQVKRMFRVSGLGQRKKAWREDYLDKQIGTIRAEQHPPEVDFTDFEHPSAISEPNPLPDDIPYVPAFDPALLPDSLRPFITDVAERMQCPVDYPATACMVVLSAVVGRQVTIRPQEQDDWTVVPNLWGAIIGPPGAMKSPPTKEVLKPIEVLEETARERHENDLTAYEAKLKVAKQANKVADQKIKKALGDGDEQRAEEIAAQSKRQDPKLPTRQRYLTQDTTIEKLGELLAGNPNGILVYRDELVGWLRTMEKQGHESDRAFYLEAWDGNGRFTFDRIGRGTVEIEAATVSILGSIQPGPLSVYLTSALKGGAGDDGLLQRFQLIVWPDQSKTWIPVDRKPNAEARQQAFEVFRQLSALHQIEAHRDISSPLPYLRFDPEAQPIFKEWRERLEQRLRAGNEPEAFESVIAKQRSLVPSLALLIHLAEHLEGGPVTLSVLKKAIGWVEYLERHARRIYATALDSENAAVIALVKRIQEGYLENVFSYNKREAFTARDIYSKHWKGLDLESTKEAIAWLVEAGWLWEQTVETGGRPTTYYHVHPSVLK